MKPQKYLQALKPALPYLGLALFTLIFFWPLTMGINPLKWDMLDCALPWRYYISESLQNGFFPWWNPYQELGYPLHADPQASPFYPIIWLFSFLFGYSPSVLRWEFLLHIYIAGIAMYSLGRTLKFKKAVSYTMGIAFMFSGFFMGNAQHFYVIFGAAWLPLIIAFFIRLYREPDLKNVLGLAITAFMLLSGGYPGIMIISFYFFLLLFFFYVLELVYQANWKKLKRYLLYSAMAVLLIGMLSAVIIYSTAHVMPFLTRAGGLDLATAQCCPFSPKSFISFISPYASVAEAPSYDTDISMTNAYVGLLPLVFALFALTLSKNRFYWLVTGFTALALCISVGEHLPFHSFLYYYVPGMDLFRFPAFFRLFAIIGLIILAGLAMSRWTEEVSRWNKNFVSFLIFVLAAFFFLWFRSLMADNLDMQDFLRSSFVTMKENSLIRQHLVFQLGIQIVLLGTFVLLHFLKKRNSWKSIALIAIVSLDMMLAVNLNTPYTATLADVSHKDFQTKFQELPQGFPVPDQRNICLNNDAAGGFGPVWRNLNILYKTPGYDGFTSFHLDGFRQIENCFPNAFSQMLEHPFVWITDDVRNHTMVYADSISSYTVFCAEQTECLKTEDSLLASAECTDFSSQGFSVKTETNKPSYLILMQNYMKGWTCELNGTEVPIEQINLSIMGVRLDKGNHHLVFRYEPVGLKISFYTTLIGLLSMLFVFLLSTFRKPHGWKKRP